MFRVDRVLLATLVLAIGLNESFAALTGIENAIGGDATLLENVLTMETTYDPHSWRRIEGAAFAVASGVLITITHFVSGALCLWASIQLGLVGRSFSSNEYATAKLWSTAGIGIGCVLYLLGFVTIAGGWFQLWQSTTINFIPEAQMLMFSYMFVLIYSHHVE